MLSLRKKLLLGFGGLLLIIILLGLQSITKVTELGGAIDIILRENYQSVIACQKMKESLERLDSGALFILSGNEKEGRDLIERNMPEFEKALQTELKIITLPGEGEKAARVKTLFEQYRPLIKNVEGQKLSQMMRDEIYFDKLQPLFQNIKNTTDDILYINQQNMFEANQQARHKATAAREHMFILLFIGVAVAAVYISLVGKWILRPIKRLTQSVEEIKRGNLDLVVKSDGRDEIGRLSEAFNEMTASLREFRRRDEEKLFRIQVSTQQTFNNLPDIVAITDTEGHIEIATETAGNIFGLKRNVKIQSLPFDWMKSLFEDALKGHQVPMNKNNVSLIQQFINAEEHYFQPAAAPILNSKKEVTGVILILKDITEQLEHSELKRGVISTVSHQLKTPLTSIRMALHLLLEEKIGPLNPTQTELLVTAREETERLNRILENLLDISRIVSGKMAIEFHNIQPYKIAHEAAESFRSKAIGHGIKLHTLLPGDLPDVWADAEQIEHVFSNLLLNALRYTESGGAVTISARADDKQVLLSVSDTGSGIPEQYLPKIFERFFRIPGQDTEAGTGLGLSIVKEIVEAHGGSVGVESREGVGSTFSFTLPRADIGPGKNV